MIDVCEIFVHWHAGRSKNEIAGSLGVDRKTLSGSTSPRRRRRAWSRAGPPVSEQEWAELVREWFPELADTRLRQVTWPAIAAHHDYIVAQLKAGVTDVHDPSAAAGRAGPGGSRGAASAGMWRRTCRRRPAGRRCRCCGPRPAEAGQRGADRLRAAGPVAGPGDRAAA